MNPKDSLILARIPDSVDSEIKNGQRLGRLIYGMLRDERP